MKARSTSDFCFEEESTNIWKTANRVVVHPPRENVKSVNAGHFEVEHHDFGKWISVPVRKCSLPAQIIDCFTTVGDVVNGGRYSAFVGRPFEQKKIIGVILRNQNRLSLLHRRRL